MTEKLIGFIPLPKIIIPSKKAEHTLKLKNNKIDGLIKYNRILMRFLKKEFIYFSISKEIQINGCKNKWIRICYDLVYIGENDNILICYKIDENLQRIITYEYKNNLVKKIVAKNEYSYYDLYNIKNIFDIEEYYDDSGVLNEQKIIINDIQPTSWEKGSFLKLSFLNNIKDRLNPIKENIFMDKLDELEFLNNFYNM